MTEVHPCHVAQEIAPSRALSALLKDCSYGLVSEGAFVEPNPFQKAFMGGRSRTVADDAVESGGFCLNWNLGHMDTRKTGLLLQ